MVANFTHQYDEKFLKQQVKISYFWILVLTTIGVYNIYQQHQYGWFFIAAAVLVGLFVTLPNVRKKCRIEYILRTPIPRQLWLNHELRSLQLDTQQKNLVENALKDFFILHALAPKKPLAMPSQSVDKLWHAFILDTHRYQSYCQKAFGKVFHHTPDYQFSDRGRNIEMFTWQMACRIQGISPANPITVPRLFSADKILAGTLIGSFLWESYQTQMALMYRQWHAQTFTNNTTESIADIGSSYDDSCNVGLSDSGDCSCGGSGGDSSGGDSGCGGGCGGD